MTGQGCTERAGCPAHPGASGFHAVGGRKPRRKPHRYHLPETIPEGEVWIEVGPRPRDEEGRVQFSIMWPEDIRWRGGGLVAGQVQFADERHTAARMRDQGNRVLYWPGGHDVPAPTEEKT